MEFFLGAFERDWERRRAALLHEVQVRQAPDLDWDEIAELVTESYCAVAPKRLVAMVRR